MKKMGWGIAFRKLIEDGQRGGSAVDFMGGGNPRDAPTLCRVF